MTLDLNLDLFAGPGGWSEALRALGLREIGLEWDTAACRTRAAAGHATIQTDVSAYPAEPFAGRIRGLIASPTCTPYSRAGKGLGLVDQPLVHQAVDDLSRGRDTRASLLAVCKDPRSILAAEPMRWIHDLRPEWIAMEQVPDVLPLWKQYEQVLRGWGYSAWCGILNAADYGVPQTRRRAILIASRVRTVGPPPPTHTQHPMGDDLFGESLQRWVPMAAALGWDMEQDGPWALRNGTQKNACTRYLDEPAGTLFFAARLNDVSWVLRSRRDSPNWVAKHGARDNRGTDEPAPTFTGEAHRWGWTLDRPATTVCATNRIAPPGHRDRSPGGESQFASPDTVRITTEEAAILQSFRADYPWQGTRTKVFEQVGNAVPPLLACTPWPPPPGCRCRPSRAWLHEPDAPNLTLRNFRE